MKRIIKPEEITKTLTNEQILILAEMANSIPPLKEWIEINKYLSDIRFKCNRCPKKFLSQKTMKDHLKTMHR